MQICSFFSRLELPINMLKFDESHTRGNKELSVKRLNCLWFASFFAMSRFNGCYRIHKKHLQRILKSLRNTSTINLPLTLSCVFMIRNWIDIGLSCAFHFFNQLVCAWLTTSWQWSVQVTPETPGELRTVLPLLFLLPLLQLGRNSLVGVLSFPSEKFWSCGAEFSWSWFINVSINVAKSESQNTRCEA